MVIHFLMARKGPIDLQITKRRGSHLLNPIQVIPKIEPNSQLIAKHQIDHQTQLKDI